MQPNENWRPVMGWESLYEVSDLGRVRSLVRVTARGKRGGRELSPVTLPNGYTYVTLRNAPAASNAYMHRLVLEAFVGQCPGGCEARHFPDNDRSNCRLENLLWGTRAQNMRDKVQSGTQTRGGAHHNSKLSDEQAREIVEARRAGTKLRMLAKRYGIAEQTVSKVARGDRWAHLQ